MCPSPSASPSPPSSYLYIIFFFSHSFLNLSSIFYLSLFHFSSITYFISFSFSSFLFFCFFLFNIIFLLLSYSLLFIYLYDFYSHPFSQPSLARTPSLRSSLLLSPAAALTRPRTVGCWRDAEMSPIKGKRRAQGAEGEREREGEAASGRQHWRKSSSVSGYEREIDRDRYIDR